MSILDAKNAFAKLRGAPEGSGQVAAAGVLFAMDNGFFAHVSSAPVEGNAGLRVYTVTALAKTAAGELVATPCFMGSSWHGIGDRRVQERGVTEDYAVELMAYLAGYGRHPNADVPLDERSLRGLPVARIGAAAAGTVAPKPAG